MGEGLSNHSPPCTGCFTLEDRPSGIRWLGRGRSAGPVR